MIEFFIFDNQFVGTNVTFIRAELSKTELLIEKIRLYLPSKSTSKKVECSYFRMYSCTPCKLFIKKKKNC